jgi:hypothetical protein
VNLKIAMLCLLPIATALVRAGNNPSTLVEFHPGIGARNHRTMTKPAPTEP